MSKKLSRRDMLKYSTGILAGTVLASCAPATPTQAPAAVEPTKAPEAPKPTEPTATTAAAAPAPAEPTATAAPKAVEGHVVVMHNRTEFTEDQMKAFEKDHPGITLEFVEGMDLTRFYAMFAAGTPPDLLRVQAPSIPQFLARKLLYDLTPYFETSRIVAMSFCEPRSW